ncbi:MAG: MlaD family protein [Candidatus Muiribacteriaceae bacterium]
MNRKIMNGIFLFAGLTVLAVLVFFVDDFSGMKEQQRIYVLFDNVQALTEGSLVYYNGVNCGSVSQISFYGKKVKVCLSFKKKVNLTEDIKVSIKTGGLVGEKYVDVISRSDQNSRTLKNGEVINGLESYSFDTLIVSVNRLSEEMKYTFERLNNLIDRNTDEVDRIFGNIDRTTGKASDFMDNLNSNMESMSQELERVLKTVGDEVNGMSPEFKKTLRNMNGLLEKFTGVIEVIEGKKDKIGVSIDNIQDITDNIRVTSDKINRVVNSEENELIEIIDSFNHFKSSSEYSFTYSDKDDRLYSGISVLFTNPDDKFFSLGVKRIGFDSLFNLEIGRRINRRGMFVYGGVLDDTPGLGIGHIINDGKVFLYNSDINENDFNLKLFYKMKKGFGIGFEFLDVFDKKDFELYLKSDL